MATKAHIEEMKALIESGDLSLADARKWYQDEFGRPTTLTDDQIIEMYADDVDGERADDPHLNAVEMKRREG